MFFTSEARLRTKITTERSKIRRALPHRAQVLPTMRCAHDHQRHLTSSRIVRGGGPTHRATSDRACSISSVITATVFGGTGEATRRRKTIRFQKLPTRIKSPEYAARKGGMFAGCRNLQRTTRTATSEETTRSIVYHIDRLIVGTKQHSCRKRPTGVDNLLSLSRSVDYTSQLHARRICCIEHAHRKREIRSQSAGLPFSA
jgi:hypothetical protein